MKKPDATTVMAHIDAGDVQSVAAQLRVLIYPGKEGGYIAQGLEIDYVSTGCTVDEVQDHFAKGLLLTVQSYLRRGRSLDALFQKGRTPTEAWQRWFSSDRHVLTCGTVVDLARDLPADAPFFRSLAFCKSDIALNS